MAVGEVIAFIHARNKCTHGSVNSNHIARDEETFVSAFPKITPAAELNISWPKRIRRSFLQDILKSDL